MRLELERGQEFLGFKIFEANYQLIHPLPPVFSGVSSLLLSEAEPTFVTFQFASPMT
jgi:hypothetical protein